MIYKKAEKRLIWLVCLVSLMALSYSQDPRNFLSGKITEQELKSVIIRQKIWHPYPTINNPDQWSSIPLELKNRCINIAESYLDKPWEMLPATDFLDFSRNGNRSRYEEIFFKVCSRKMAGNTMLRIRIFYQLQNRCDFH